MVRKRLSKGLRKFIRKEKARIRREILDIGTQEKLISELYQKILRNSKPKSNTRTNKKNANEH